MHLILSLLLSLAARADVNECDLLAHSLRVMAPKLSKSLTLAEVDYNFSRPQAEKVKDQFAAGVDCEKLKPEQRKRIFLLLSNIESTWALAEREKRHPSLNELSRETVAQVVELLGFYPSAEPFSEQLLALKKRLRRDHGDQLPDQTELQVAKLYGRSGIGLLSSLEKDARWIYETFQTGELPILDKDKQRAMITRGADIVIHLTEFEALLERGITSARIERIFGAFVDALYGPAVATNYLMANPDNHLRVVEQRNTRLSFFRNSSEGGEPFRDVDQTPREILNRVEPILSNLLFRFAKGQAAALTRDRIWSFNFAWDPSTAYARTDAAAIASPIAYRELTSLISDYFQLEPKTADAELYRLVLTLNAYLDDSEWPSVSLTKLRLAKVPEEVNSVIVDTLQSIMIETGISCEGADFCAEIPPDRKNRKVVLARDRFLSSAKLEAHRIRVFQEKMLGCMDALKGN